MAFRPITTEFFNSPSRMTTTIFASLNDGHFKLSPELIKGAGKRLCNEALTSNFSIPGDFIRNKDNNSSGALKSKLPELPPLGCPKLWLTRSRNYAKQRFFYS